MALNKEPSQDSMEALMSKSALTFSRRQSLQGLALVGAGASLATPAFSHRVAAAVEKVCTSG